MALAFPSTSVKRLVQVLQWVTWLWFIILISSFFAGLVFTKPLLRLAYDTWLINFEGDWLGPVQGLGLWPIMAMTTLPSLYAIWSLNRFLTEVLQGRTFSIRAIKGFRFFSLGIVIAAALHPFQETLLIGYISWLSPHVSLIWYWGEPLMYLWEIGVGLLFIWLSYVMELAKVHQDDVDSFL